MRATAVEFRLRMLINATIIVLGIWSPWVPAEKRTLVLEWLPLEVARMGLMPFSEAVSVLLVVAGVFAALGVVLRVSGTAWLGPMTVTHSRMRADAVIASGPYRYLRNPLYAGVWCMIAAVALIMPPSGALFSLVLLAIFLVRLTLGEEAFLFERLGEPYRAYLRAVPRFLPRLRNDLRQSTAKPQWIRAIVSELTPIGILVSVVVLAWSYDARLMGRIVLIGFGCSLVGRALLPRTEADVTTAA